MGSVSRLAQSDTDAILPVSLGTAVWAIALVALVAVKPTLDANGTTWWIGVAAVGFASGAIGLVFLRWRRGQMGRRGQE